LLDIKSKLNSINLKIQNSNIRILKLKQQTRRLKCTDNEQDKIKKENLKSYNWKDSLIERKSRLNEKTQIIALYNWKVGLTNKD
jgi:hypothetical protein